MTQETKPTVGLFRMVCHKCKKRCSCIATSEPVVVRAYLNQVAVFLCLECGENAMMDQSLESLGLGGE